MDVQYVNLSSDDSRVGIVISQDPEAGVKADVGLTVTIVVGQAIGGGDDDVPRRRGQHDDLVPADHLTWPRKFANSWWPPTVSTDSGWNCTPSTGCSR